MISTSTGMIGAHMSRRGPKTTVDQRLKALDSQNRRYREALKDIAYDGFSPDRLNDMDHAYELVARIRRRALAGLAPEDIE